MLAIRTFRSWALTQIDQINWVQWPRSLSLSPCEACSLLVHRHPHQKPRKRIKKFKKRKTQSFLNKD
uniref:Uncharacterized protein n=1 Tax=Rhizophora mucronata TaxID=61149 RepID=A0A2P2IYW7_RHIMU